MRSDRILSCKAPEVGASRLLMAAAPVTFEAAAGEGKLPRFSMVAYTGGPMRTGFSNNPVVVDLQGLQIPSQALPIRFQHDAEKGVGHSDSIKIENGQVTAAGIISRATPQAQEVISSSKAGFPWQASIGAEVEEYEYVKPGLTVLVNGQSVSGPFLHITKSVLNEISFVDLGADRKTSATVAAASRGIGLEDRQMSFDEWLKAKGFDVANLKADQRLFLEGCFKVEQEKSVSTVTAKAPPPAVGTDEVAAGRERQALETERVASVRLACGGKHPEIEAKAIREGWTSDRTELAVLRAERPTAPVPGVGSSVNSGQFLKIVEAALCLKHQLVSDSNLVATYGAEVSDQAYKMRKARFSDMARELCARSGKTLPMEVGSGDWIRAAFSSADLSGILGNVANKALAAVIANPSYVAPLISAAVSHSNFFEHTVYSLALNGNLEEVAPTGELKHLNLSEESYTRQLKTRGALLRITRQDLVNDDLSAFARTAQSMVRRAYETRELLLFTAINATGAGSTFFTTGHSNYLSGATTALDSTGMAKAIKAFRNQTGPDGKPILVEPAILLVPSSLEDAARRLLVAGSNVVVSGLASTSAKSLESSANIYGGRFGGAPVVSPYLELASLTGYSLTAWYLLASPSVLPAFEIAYLNGVQTPTIEYFGLDSDIDTLGVSWRIYWDFGVGTAEYRAGVKSAGV